MEIDWQGARQVRQSIPECVSIFILPPSKDELRKRLINRATDDPKTIELRIKEASRDMHQWPDFDYCIINNTKNLMLLEKINEILCINDR